MNNKKKIIIACIIILATCFGGLFIKNHKINNQQASSTRVVQEKKDSNKKDKYIERNKEKDRKEKNKKDEDKKNTKEEKQSEKQEEKNKNPKESNTINKPSGNNLSDGKKKTEDKRTVYIRIEGYDKTLVSRTQVTTGVFDLNPYLGSASGSSATASKGWGVDKFKEPTNAHAVVKALESHGFKKGSDYDFQDYGWGLYIAMIGGNREFDYRSTSGWMYRVNNVLPNVGCQGRPIQNGDEILWYFGAYGFDTLATELKVSATNVKVGEPVIVTLNGIKNDINTWKEYREPAKGAIIYSNGSPLKLSGSNVITDEGGKATIKFDKPGTYNLSAERINKSNLKDIVRPQLVTVTVK